MNTLSHSTFLLALASAVSVSLSACVLPYHFTDAPAVAGQVVSSATNRPVAGAAVSMIADKESVQTQTDQTGRFHLPAIQHWGTFAYPTDGFLDGSGSLRVEAAGYNGHTEEAGFTNSVAKQRRTGAELKNIHVVLTPHLTTRSSGRLPTAGSLVYSVLCCAGSRR